MARGPDAVALDGKIVRVDRNAAIWFAADGYDPVTRGLNGRRVAGETFLRGFFRHADVDEFVSLAHSGTELSSFARFAATQGRTQPVRGVRLDQVEKIAPISTVFFSSPGIGPECWRRAPLGATHHSICGITHTTATKAVMEQVWSLRMAPQMQWDAIICTSRAVRSAIEVQFDLIDAQTLHRFAGRVPPRPQLPVIPLGVHCQDLAPDPAAGAALRARLGLGADDILCLTVARLTPHGKFDPLPLYLALAEAQMTLATTVRLHLALCGSFPDTYSRDVFMKGAAALMPDLPLHHIDKADDALRLAALSGADLFLFPIDNVQEAFGIAPVEAMAAGLPVIASDWDGLRDTVNGQAGRDQTGILIATEAVRADLTTTSAQRHLGGTDSFIQYQSQMSALTRIDVGAMARAIATLAGDADMRKRLGAAGQVRARVLFDWGVVIPQMQNLWAELGQIRRASDPAANPPIPTTKMPVAPAPTTLFAAYPSRLFAPENLRFRAVALGTRPGARETMELRNYIRLGRVFELPVDVQTVADALPAPGTQGATLAEIVVKSGLPPGRVERVLMWLLKYHFAVEDTDGT
jgi:glycosyltransferase involved in cell wall biosynthesis